MWPNKPLLNLYRKLNNYDNICLLDYIVWKCISFVIILWVYHACVYNLKAMLRDRSNEHIVHCM